MDRPVAAGTARGIDDQPILTWEWTTMAFLLELWAFMKARKKFWLLPILLVMLVFGGLLVFAQGSAIAPFIYTLF